MQIVLLLYREKKYQTETTQKEELFVLTYSFRDANLSWRWWGA